MLKKQVIVLWHGSFMLLKRMLDAEENKKNYYLREHLSLKIILWAQAGEFKCHCQKVSVVCAREI